MALSIKPLGNGTIGTDTSTQQLLTASGYTSGAVPTGKAVIVKNVRFVNLGTAKRTLTVTYLASGGSAKAVSPSAVALPPGAMLTLDDELMLGAGDKLQAAMGESGTSTVDFVVGGVERDQ
jgi:hypothetical protein